MATRQLLADPVAMHLHKRRHMLPRRGQDDKVALRLVREPQTQLWALLLRTAMRLSQMTKL